MVSFSPLSNDSIPSPIHWPLRDSAVASVVGPVDGKCAVLGVSTILGNPISLLRKQNLHFLRGARAEDAESDCVIERDRVAEARGVTRRTVRDGQVIREAYLLFHFVSNPVAWWYCSERRGSSRGGSHTAGSGRADTSWPATMEAR